MAGWMDGSITRSLSTTAYSTHLQPPSTSACQFFHVQPEDGRCHNHNGPAYERYQLTIQKHTQTCFCGCTH